MAKQCEPIGAPDAYKVRTLQTLVPFGTVLAPVVRCSECNAQIGAKDNYCSGCGRALYGRVVWPDEVEKEKKRVSIEKAVATLRENAMAAFKKEKDTESVDVGIPGGGSVLWGPPAEIVEFE